MMSRCADWYIVTGVSEDHSVSFFGAKRSKETLTVRDLEFLTQRCSLRFQYSGTLHRVVGSIDPHTFNNHPQRVSAYPKTQPSIPASLKFSWFWCMTLKMEVLLSSKHVLYLPVDTAWHHSRLRSSATRLWEPQISLHSFPHSPFISILPIPFCLNFFLSPLCRVSFSNTTIEQFCTLIVTTSTDTLQHSILKTRCVQTSQRNQVGWGDICTYT